MENIKTKDLEEPVKIQERENLLPTRTRKSLVRGPEETGQNKTESDDTQMEKDGNSPVNYASEKVLRTSQKMADDTGHFASDRIKGIVDSGRNAYKKAQRAKFKNDYEEKLKDYKTEIKQGNNIRHTEGAPGKTVKTVKKTVKTAEHTIEESGKVTSEAVKTTEESSKVVIKTAETSGKVAVKTTEATVKASEKVAEATAKAAQKAAELMKQAAAAIGKAVSAAAKAIASAVEELGAAIAAGGWVSVIIIAILVLIMGVVGLVYGIFGEEENSTDNEGYSLQSVIASIDEKFDQKIEKIKEENPHDVLEISGEKADWKEVLAVYSVKLTLDPDNPQEVMTMTEEKEKVLRKVFEDFNEVEYAVESIRENEAYVEENASGKNESDRQEMIVCV